jgi:hypothetical protein
MDLGHSPIPLPDVLPGFVSLWIRDCVLDADFWRVGEVALTRVVWKDCAARMVSYPDLHSATIGLSLEAI